MAGCISDSRKHNYKEMLYHLEEYLKSAEDCATNLDPEEIKRIVNFHLEEDQQLLESE